eukprot:jgi/Ulvmu1/9655/UM054_0087.1
MAGWLERVLNGSITSYFGYSVRPSKHRHAESPALLTKPKRTEIALCDETLRKIIRSLYGEPKRTVEDILSLSMTCKRIRLIFRRVCTQRPSCVLCGIESRQRDTEVAANCRSLCNEPALWRDLCILHYQAPPRPVEAVPWRRLYQCEPFAYDVATALSSAIARSLLSCPSWEYTGTCICGPDPSGNTMSTDRCAADTTSRCSNVPSRERDRKPTDPTLSAVATLCVCVHDRCQRFPVADGSSQQGKREKLAQTITRRGVLELQSVHIRKYKMASNVSGVSCARTMRHENHIKHITLSQRAKMRHISNICCHTTAMVSDC